MTVVVSLACQDGLVMASDSQATELNTGSPFSDVRFPTQKLFTLGENMLWGASGDLGFVQRVKDRLEHLPPRDLKGSKEALRNTLRREVVETTKTSLQYFVQEVQPPGQPHPLVGFFLFAGRATDGRFILEVKTNGVDTLYEERGFHAIGSGYVHAQVAQAMLLHHEVRNRSTDQGLIIACRVVDTAIEAAAAGIDHPIQLALIKKDDAARILTDSEREAIETTVMAWKQAEIDTLPGLLSSPTGS
ncbi:MAG: hypothetical protein HY686_07150 [Chloroflexi bacterium]|nr:hypothetical protein [Chloroflexota bacterium]